MKTLFSFSLAAVLASLTCADAGAQQYFSHELRHAGDSATFITLPMQPGALETYFVNLKDGDVVKPQFRVIFGVVGLGIAPAGVEKEGTGHHHLLIDTSLPNDLTVPIPFSDKYRHFGGGQTEAELSLAPGKHTLQLLFANAQHRPLYKTESGGEVAIFSKKITITVAADTREANTAQAIRIAQK
ncbi:MAG TPA: DUF4399 domain-containing protein [Burkholderiaceae bacterium]|jgi:hypothetical protein